MKNSIIASLVAMTLICCNSDRTAELEVPPVNPVPPITTPALPPPPPQNVNNPLGERIKAIESVVNGWYGPITVFRYDGNVTYIDKYSGDQIEIKYIDNNKISIKAFTRDDIIGDMETHSTFEYIYTNGGVSSVIYQGLPGYPESKNVYTLNYNTENKISNVTCKDPFGAVITSDLIYSGDGEVTRLVIKKDNVVVKEHNLTYDGKKNPFTAFPIEVKLYFALAEAKGEFKLFDYAIGSFWGTQNIKTDNIPHFDNTNYLYLYGPVEYQLNMPRKFAYDVAGNIFDMQYYYE